MLRIRRGLFANHRSKGSGSSGGSPHQHRESAARADIRILHVFGQLDRGGAEVRTLEVIRATVNEPIHHEFICLSGLPGVLDEHFRDLGAVIHHIALGPLLPYRIIRLLRTRKIDILHSHVHLFSGGLVAIAALGGVSRRIAHFRSTHDGHPDTPVRRVTRAGQRLLIRWFATDILAVGTGAMDEWSIRWRDDPRCRVVLNGIDTETFDAAIRDPLTRSELGVGVGDPIVAFVGRFHPAKRPELALRSVAMMSSPTWLVCAGLVEPDLKTKFLALAVELGMRDRAIVLGLRPDVPRILALADVVIMTSSVEGLPGIVLEALAAGTRVVASRLPGTVEIAHHLDGVTLVDLNAPLNAWAASLDEVLAAPNSRASFDRSELRTAFLGSPFTLSRSAAEFTEIWLAQPKGR